MIQMPLFLVLDEDFSLNITGDAPKATWTPSKRSFRCFHKVAEIEISEEDFDTIKDEYTPAETYQQHFSPPRFPAGIWQSITSNQGDAIKLRACFKSQSYLYTALMPLLSALDSIDPSDTATIEKLTISVQLVCTANLQFNRFRRVIASNHIKRDLRSSFLKLPILHTSLFGEDFDKSADTVMKEQSDTAKVLASTPSTSRFPSKPSYPSAPRPQVPNFRPPYQPSSSDRGIQRYRPFRPYSRYRVSRGRSRGSSSFRPRH